MSERFCDLGGLRICFETFGEEADPALLLVMGLGAQMVAWPDDFCSQLAGRGFFVIRYDNRDVGRSTRFRHVPPPRRLELLTRRPKRVAYTLVDMAGDGLGLLDHLGIGGAHVVGASMGGMLAQVMAARHPDRVKSLVSIMSTTGGRLVGQPALRALPLLISRPPRNREGYVEHILHVFRALGSRGFPFDEDDLREIAGRSFDRGISASGTARQLGAILAAGDRSADLRRITAPTLVIHGTDDPLVSVSGGRATARAIPGARLMLINGMGHELPRGAWPQILDPIVANAAGTAQEQIDAAA